MKIYLAARYSRREEPNGYKADLEALGHTVTSRWLAGDHQIDDQGLSAEAKAEERTRFAQEDWEDLMAANLTISFTETPRSSNSRGGRHVEFGAALAAGQTVIVVGHRENVFHCLPCVHFCPEWSDALDFVTVVYPVKSDPNTPVTSGTSTPPTATPTPTESEASDA